SVPADNPFVGNPSARPEIWALGFRNPFTFAVAPGAGTIHVNDVGENTWEEIDVGRAGANYGWPTCEGPCADPSMQNPVYAYQHVDGNCAITGGTFYQGTRFPAEYIGAYFFADFCGNWIKVLRSDHSVANGDPLTYAWDFGDGSGTTGRTVTYAYSRDGAYILTLTVTDQRGGVAQDTVLIQVGHPPTGTVTLPPTGASYRAGDTISYA